MGLAATHDPKSVIILWDGLRLRGFTADTIAEHEDQGEPEVEVGADGFTTVTRPPGKSVIVTMTLFSSSPGYKLLSETYAEEQAAEGSLPVHEYHQENLITGDVVNDPSAVLLKGPPLSEGAGAGAREFRILLPDPEKTYGKNVTA